MKSMGIFAVIVLAAVLSACGGGSSSTNPANGAWAETLSSTTGQALGSFTFNMTQDGTALTATGMNFSNAGSLAPCFGAGTVMSGQMGQGMMNGGAMTMSVCWTAPNAAGTNCMTMQGDMGMGMHSGTGDFTLTGHTSGCTSQQGNFTMTQM